MYHPLTKRQKEQRARKLEAMRRGKELGVWFRSVRMLACGPCVLAMPRYTPPIMNTLPRPQKISNLGVAQLAESSLWKRDVAGSSPATQTSPRLRLSRY